MATGLGSYDATNLGADLVDAAKQLTLIPDHVTVYGYHHGVATTAPVVASSGYRSASYTARSDASWLHVSKGKAPGKLHWSVTPGALASGAHHGTIKVSSGGHHATLHVTYSVSPRAKLKLSKRSLRFREGALNKSGRPTIATCAGPMWDDEFFDAVNGSSGHRASPQSKQTLRISNVGARGSKLHWQALPDSQIGSWLGVDLQHGKVKTRPGRALVPTDGVARRGHASSLRLASLANGNTVGGYPGMQQGTYHGNVKVYDLADPRVVRTVHARLVLGNGNDTPYVRSYEKTSAFTLKAGGHTTFRLHLSDGSGSCGYAYSIDSNRPWVTVNSADFAGTVPPAGQKLVAVSVSAKHLEPGVHHFTVTVQSQNAEPSPNRIPFTLTVK
jgi:hypothetical protein